MSVIAFASGFVIGAAIAVFGMIGLYAWASDGDDAT